MKPQSIIAIFSGLVLLAGAMAGCEKDDRDETFGTASIYMPQATVATNRYAVPAGLDSATYNYKIDQAGDKVNVILGIARSGKQEAGAFAVTVTANPDTVANMISKSVLDPATHIVMPASLYTLPQGATVEAGKTATTFYLSINKTQLKTYAGKKLAIGVFISQPSNYILSPGGDKVIIIVDVNALKL
jgi:hypothetical protein